MKAGLDGTVQKDIHGFGVHIDRLNSGLLFLPYFSHAALLALWLSAYSTVREEVKCFGLNVVGCFWFWYPIKAISVSILIGGKKNNRKGIVIILPVF